MTTARLQWTASQPWEKLHPPKMPGDVGYDLAWSPKNGDKSEILCYPNNKLNLRTGISVHIPRGLWGYITTRSSGFQRGLVANGVIDQGWRGELFVAVHNVGTTPVRIHAGDRVGQLILMPSVVVPLAQVDELERSERGTNGFGSTGR